MRRDLPVIVIIAGSWLVICLMWSLLKGGSPEAIELGFLLALLVLCIGLGLALARLGRQRRRRGLGLPRLKGRPRA
jgi:hypothetical protein